MMNPTRTKYRYCWPSGDWGSLPLEGGIEAAFKRELEAHPDPETRLKEIRAWAEALRSPFRTAESFYAEEIIDPRDTRPLLCEWAGLGAANLGDRAKRVRHAAIKKRPRLAPRPFLFACFRAYGVAGAVAGAAGAAGCSGAGAAGASAG